MPTVLVIDDDTDFRRLLQLWLGVNGYDVAEAPNGMEALRVMSKVKPCLILLDLMMPVLDGRGFRTQQLRDPRFASIPVLCISAAHEAEQAAAELGASGCIMKPVEMDAVLDLVREYCGPADIDGTS